MGRLGRGMRWAYRWRAIVLGCSALLSCPISGARTAAVASLCGNGIVEPGEQCDDGGANGSTPCCSASCELIDGDRDGVCDALDPCTNTQLVQIEAPRLVVRLTSPGDMTFDVRGAMVVPPSPPIDAASKGIRLVMKNFYEVPLDATVPGGLGWGDSGGGGGYLHPARAVAAQEAYWTPHLAYYSGPCSGLPGFVPSPGVACTTTGTSANFIVVTAHGAARDACAWNSCLAPGRPHVVCKRGAISASCS